MAFIAYSRETQNGLRRTAARRFALLGCAIALAAGTRSSTAHADPVPGFTGIDKGVTHGSASIAGTGYFVALLAQVNYLHGIGAAGHAFLLSYEIGAGLGDKQRKEDKLYFAMDAGVTAHLSIARPEYECHTSSVFFSNGIKMFSLSSAGSRWPVYLGPSFGLTLIFEVHHNACQSWHDWPTGSQPNRIFNLSYIELLNINQGDRREGLGHGLIFTCSL